MKFKNDNTFEEPCRTLTMTDYEGDVLTVHRFDSKCNVVIAINEHVAFGTTEAKAIKLAYAILDELDPSYF